MSLSVYQLKSKKRDLVLDLNHGLGNQLSLYFAGLAYCLEFNRNLVVTLCESQKNNHDSYRDIKDLFLPGEFSDRSKNISGFRAKLEQFIAYRFPSTFRVTGNYYSSLPGFDQMLLRTSGIYRLHGFFHSYAYFDFCRERISSLSLQEIFPLGPYASEIANQLNGQNSVAMHIRRGDYSHHSDSFGILGTSYYRDALASLGLNSPDNFCFIFSDDYHSALKITKSLGISNAIFPDRDGLLKASEVIHLLAISSNLIIGNSSMSYWAAVLASLETTVVAPKPFYRNQEISESFFYRANWKLISAKYHEA